MLAGTPAAEFIQGTVLLRQPDGLFVTEGSVQGSSRKLYVNAPLGFVTAVLSSPVVRRRPPKRAKCLLKAIEL